MKTLNTKCLLITLISIGLTPAFARADCFGAEPICDYPLVAVCVQQQYGQTAWQGQGQIQSVWTCQEKSSGANAFADSRSKKKAEEKNAKTDPGFFSKGFVDGSNSDSKNGNQRSDELFKKN